MENLLGEMMLGGLGIVIVILSFTRWTRDRAVTLGIAVSYTHLRAHETGRNLVCRLLLEKKKKKKKESKKGQKK